ncbi:probable bifunctional methylthioribulose-1-phosphate dehydratase/enolase-phosphatase E1, partial [Tanacetum coccineum]
NKRETKSNIEISKSLGVDKPLEVLFITDVVQEAAAAKAAGLEVIISFRPGNGPLLRITDSLRAVLVRLCKGNV